MSEHSDGVGVVVGATGSLGGAIARRLVACGLPVVAVARSAERLDELAAESALIRPCVADIGDDAAVEQIASALDQPVRMAVMAAGLPVRGSADTIEPGGFALATNIKVGGLTRLLHAVRDRLEPGSRFVTLTGYLAREPKPFEAVPGVINAALHNLMRQISLLYGPRGVTVHTVSPGPVDTPRLRRIATATAEERGVPFDEVWQGFSDESSLGRLVTIDQVAWVVETLLNPHADVLHGGVLSLDAGRLRGI